MQQRSLLILLTVPVAFVLKGCDIPQHDVGNWRSKPSYLLVHDVLPPGADPTTGAVLNSCQGNAVAAPMQCSGHGKCVEWTEVFLDTSAAAMPPASDGSEAPPLSFCKCDVGWADPECRTQRKSQVTAFLLSVVFGMLGADLFYLGYIWGGILKLVTLGGFGVWYIFDIVRIGSAPAITLDRFKVANDLHHTAFLLVLICLMLVFGFIFSVMSISQQRQQKAREIMILRVEGANSPLLAGGGADADDLNAAKFWGDDSVVDGFQDAVGPCGNAQSGAFVSGGCAGRGVPPPLAADGFRGYGATLAAPLAKGMPSGSVVYGSAPLAEPMARVSGTITYGSAPLVEPMAQPMPSGTFVYGSAPPAEPMANAFG